MLYCLEIIYCLCQDAANISTYDGLCKLSYVHMARGPSLRLAHITFWGIDQRHRLDLEVS
eukprot:SAG31_NODE_23984_length_491_cov_1.711735_1_plen_59_part_10